MSIVLFIIKRSLLNFFVFISLLTTLEKTNYSTPAISLLPAFCLKRLYIRRNELSKIHDVRKQKRFQDWNGSSLKLIILIIRAIKNEFLCGYKKIFFSE